MAKFLKNLFTSSSSMKIKQDKEVEVNEEPQKELPSPYDTKRKLSISRSGRMKQNLKNRGKLNGELFGEETPKCSIKTLEYRVNKRNFFDDDSAETSADNKNEKENDMGNKTDPQHRLENHDINQSNNKLDKIDNTPRIIKEHNHKIYNNEADEESADLAMFEKNIEQILQYKESDF